jgi:hypothetical protein
VRAAGRFGAYGLLGWGIEVCYTAAMRRAAGAGDNRLAGESYVWMFPIYGLGGLAGEMVAALVRGRPLPVRAVAYSLTFFAVEAASGEALRRLIGDVPWGEEYRTHADQLGGGLIRLSYAPNWAIAGLALERVAPVVARLELEPSGRRPAE